MICCGLLPYVQLRFAIPYKIGELPTLAPVLRVLCERPLTIVFEIVSESKGMGSSSTRSYTCVR